MAALCRWVDEGGFHSLKSENHLFVGENGHLRGHAIHATMIILGSVSQKHLAPTGPSGLKQFKQVNKQRLAKSPQGQEGVCKGIPRRQIATK